MTAEDIKQAIAVDTEEIIFDVSSIYFHLVRIPEGEFNMGSPSSEEGHNSTEEPMRLIKISKAFYLGRYQITQTQYNAFMGIHRSNFQGDDLAVDQVLYSEALEFCKRLSQYLDLKVTLPTEAQWEYACRAGTQTRFYSGDTPEDLDEVAWYKANSNDRIHEVGQKKPNAWGLYDMHGNVWEPCIDSIPSYATIPYMDPIGTVQPRKGIMRGGGWMNELEYCRAACRVMSNDRFGGMGIRIAINPDD